MSAGAAGGGVPLSRLAEHAGGEVLGDGGLAITGVSSLAEAGPGDLSYVESDRFAEAARSSRASALFVARPLDGVACAQVVVAEPRYALALVTERYFVPARAAKGVDPRAAVGDDVEIGADPSIWAFATVADGARLGARVTLYPGVFIGPGAVVGDDCVLYPHVSVREGSVIGDRVRIHNGTVIGSDGFGYVQHGGRHQKVPQIGGVTIEDDVEIGANVTVDRGTFGHTRIRRGAKIDNLVQVAHNVVIGEHAIVVAQVGISGSTAVGDGVVIGGQAGIAGHIQIGAGAMLAARTGVNRSLPGGRVYSGVPAMPHEQSMMAYAVIPRLPELRRQVRELERRLRELEEGRG